MHDRPPILSIVVPTFNESRNVARLVQLLDRAMERISWEVIFVDDDSSDGTWTVVKQLAQTDPRVRCIRRVGRRGLAGACIEGALSSAAPYVAVMDADLQHDETILPAMVGLLEREQADLVIGSRFVDGGTSRGGLSERRAFASRLATWLARAVVGKQVSDPMSGFFAVKREVFEAAAPGLITSGFKILLDILVNADSSLRTAEIGYHFRSRGEGESKFDGRAMADFAALLVHRCTAGVVPVRFLLFMIVGAIGVGVHLVALRMAMILAGLSFEWAQGFATLVAMTSNYIVNNLLTYRDMKLRGLPALGGLLRFYAVCSLGAVANLGVASWVFGIDESWWFAGLAGAIMGAVFNYTMSSIFVWRQRA